MNDEHRDANKERLRDAWIESLLESTIHPENHRDRIEKAMQRIDAVPQSRTRTGWQKRVIWQWGSVAAAVAVLTSIIVLGHGNESAMAAVERSLTVAAEPLTRRYTLQLHYQNETDAISEFNHDLYVQGHNRFVLRYPGILPGAGFWIGRNGSDSWVLPPIGPVLTGNNTALSRWISEREELNTPELHVTTVLSRMLSKGYRLETLADETIQTPEAGQVRCNRILAQRVVADSQDLPSDIELWASEETDMAIQIVGTWNRPKGQSGKKKIVIRFKNDEPLLGESWFTPQDHYEGTRPTVRFDRPVEKFEGGNQR